MADGQDGVVLRECPFCGGEARYNRAAAYIRVQCGTCGALCGVAYHEQARVNPNLGERARAVAAWNCRASVLDRQVSARPMDTAPRNNTPIRLLVRFDNYRLKDTLEPHWTIGSNGFDHCGVDEWEIAGWSWIQDCYMRGEGVPLGWLPLTPEPPGLEAGAEPQTAIKAVERLKVGSREGFTRDQQAAFNAAIECAANAFRTALPTVPTPDGDASLRAENTSLQAENVRLNKEVAALRERLDQLLDYCAKKREAQYRGE